MSPNIGPSTPARVSASGKLGGSVRHTPYPLRHSSKSSNSSGASNPLLRKSSSTASAGARLRPTFSMLEELEVEGLLGSGISSQESMQSLSRASSLSQSQDSLGHYPSPTNSVDHLRGFTYYQSSARPLSREWSAATTVLEIPGGPARDHPSYGTFESFSGSSSQSSDDDKKVDEMSWVAATPVPILAPRRFMTLRSTGDESESDSDRVSMENIAIRLPLQFALGGDGSTDTLSSSSSSSPTTDGLHTPAESPIRKRIWEIRPEEYIPRPQGLPPQSVASVLEIGMQWERAHQGDSPRSKDEKRAVGAVGHIRRIHGDAQYMN